LDQDALRYARNDKKAMHETVLIEKIERGLRQHEIGPRRELRDQRDALLPSVIEDLRKNRLDQCFLKPRRLGLIDAVVPDEPDPMIDAHKIARGRRLALQ